MYNVKVQNNLHHFYVPVITNYKVNRSPINSNNEHHKIHINNSL